jgi:FkbM family methyltransferase
LAPGMHLSRHGIGARDEEAVLYAKAHADSGASLHQVIERGSVVQGVPAATIHLRAAAAVLREIGINRHTLLKIDIEGTEYQVLPAIASLLAEAKPWLHVSFHPFNLFHRGDPYRTDLARLRGMLDVAEALASYRFLHIFSNGVWETVEADDRLEFLRHYLLRAKPVPRVRSAQYGFINAVAFSEQPLPNVP